MISSTHNHYIKLISTLYYFDNLKSYYPSITDLLGLIRSPMRHRMCSPSDDTSGHLFDYHLFCSTSCHPFYSNLSSPCLIAYKTQPLYLWSLPQRGCLARLGCVLLCSKLRYVYFWLCSGSCFFFICHAIFSC